MIYTFELLLNLLLSDFPSSTTRQEVARGQLSGGYWLGAYARDDRAARPGYVAA